MNRLSHPEFLQKLRSVKLLALDVDGVLTDDSIYFGPDKFEMKRFNISDGLFIVLAMRSGLEIAIVSGRSSPATTTRMDDLGVKHVLQGMKCKIKMIEPLLEQLGLGFDDVAFVGNEILDIPLAERVGLPIAVSDSCGELKKRAAYITQATGGNGAVREVIEAYFEARKIVAMDHLL